MHGHLCWNYFMHVCCWAGGGTSLALPPTLHTRKWSGIIRITQWYSAAKILQPNQIARVININQSNSLKRVLKCAALIAIMPLAESVFKSLLSGFSCQIFAASQAHYTLTPCFLTSHSHHTPILRLLFYSSYIPQCTTE